MDIEPEYSTADFFLSLSRKSIYPVSPSARSTTRTLLGAQVRTECESCEKGAQSADDPQL